MSAPLEERLPAAGTVRRLQALAVAGWPLRRLARELGLSPTGFARLMSAATVPVPVSRAVAALYDRLCLARPVLCGVAPAHAHEARARAAAAGWAPIGAWDDDTIDDPAAIPNWTGYCGTSRGADLHERHNLPLCPPCQAALYRRRLHRAARARRAMSTT